MSTHHHRGSRLNRGRGATTHRTHDQQTGQYRGKNRFAKPTLAQPRSVRMLSWCAVFIHINHLSYKSQKKSLKQKNSLTVSCVGVIAYIKPVKKSVITFAMRWIDAINTQISHVQAKAQVKIGKANQQRKPEAAV